jgi:hypothetical protein
MPTLDEEIARHLRQASESGELQSAKGYGEPLADAQGWHETPEALRMPFKILKDAGVVPPEIEMFQERARLRAALDQASAPDEKLAARRKLSELEQSLALRLESLRINSSL